MSNDTNKLPPPWKDVTSFSQGQKDRTPTTFEIKIGRFKVIVMRHRYYEPDEWVSKCYGLWDDRKIESKNLREAADQALGMLETELRNALNDITKATVRKRSMEYNKCAVCGAKDGRAGPCVNGECLNCHDTRRTGRAVVHSHLKRSPDELARTFAIIPDQLNPNELN